MPDKAIPFVKAFGGFSDGSCASAGYTEKEGEQNGTGDKDKDRTYTIYGKEMAMMARRSWIWMASPVHHRQQHRGRDSMNALVAVRRKA